MIVEKVEDGCQRVRLVEDFMEDALAKHPCFGHH
jgi:hypothetical protein